MMYTSSSVLDRLVFGSACSPRFAGPTVQFRLFVCSFVFFYLSFFLEGVFGTCGGQITAGVVSAN